MYTKDPIGIAYYTHPYNTGEYYINEYLLPHSIGWVHNPKTYIKVKDPKLLVSNWVSNNAYYTHPCNTGE